MGMKNAAPMLRLVQNKPSEDLIETLAWLLQEASAGRITGIAYGATAPGRQFFCDVVGEARSDPVRGIGLAQYVAHDLTSRLMSQEMPAG